MKIRVILKGGGDFTVSCDDYEATINLYGELRKLDITGMSDGHVIHLDLAEVAAIIREGE